MSKKNSLLIESLQKRLQKKIEFKSDEVIFFSKEITVDDLSKSMNLPTSFLIMFFLKEEGITVTKNKNLEKESIESFLKTKNLKASFKEKTELINEFIKENLFSGNREEERKELKSIVVSVMGHIDHGKSSLLDSIMGTSEQIKEDGGITQKINVYPKNFKDKKITFLDTPGHNLFIKMREKSSLIADLVILVIDAKEGIKDQTLEVIDHIKKNKIPTIVFLNNKKKEKIDEKILNNIMSDLQKNSINPIDWGGDTIVITGKSTRKEDGVKVLENIYEISEIYDWKANSNSETVGIFLDSYTSSKEGIVNIALIKNGTLRKNDNLFTANNFGKINRIIGFDKKESYYSKPGEIVQIFGLGFQSENGEGFFVNNEKNSKKKLEKIISKDTDKNIKKISFIPKTKKLEEDKEKKELNIVLLANSQSSIGALESLIKKISKDFININIIYSETSEISEKIFDICKITGSSIVAFNTKINDIKLSEAKKNGIKVISESIIYKIEEKIEKLINKLKDKKMIERVSGIAEVKEIFYSSSLNGNIAGCDVISGVISKGNRIEVFRKDKNIFSGQINGLQRSKSSVKEAKKGQECGIVVNGFNEFLKKDKIIFYLLSEDEN